jgi:hypothetical protein
MAKIDRVVLWKGFRPHLEVLWRKPSARHKLLDTVVMFKATMFCALYNR